MFKRVIVFLLVVLCSLHVVLAVCSPPANGDWFVAAGIEACENQEVVINGNLRFSGTAVLSLANSNFSLNSSFANEFEANFSDSATMNTSDASIFLEQSSFTLNWFNNSVLDFLTTNISNSTPLFVEGNSTATFDRVNISNDLNLRSTSTSVLQRVIMSKFDSSSAVNRLDMVGTASVTIKNSTINAEVGFGSAVGTPTVLVHSSSFTNNSEFRGTGTTVNFIDASNITHVEIYANSPIVNGSINFSDLVPDNIIATNYQRYYPVFVEDQNGNPQSARVVNITNSSGIVIWQGVTDINGFVQANVNYSITLCGISGSACDNDFTIATNPNETLGLQTNTPILLTVQVTSNAPEFSTYTLMLALVLTISGFVAIRRRSE